MIRAVAMTAVCLTLALGALALLGLAVTAGGPTDEQLVRARCEARAGWDATPAQLDGCARASERERR